MSLSFNELAVKLFEALKIIIICFLEENQLGRNEKKEKKVITEL